MERLSIWNYLSCLGLAVIVEIIATAPVWGLIGAGPGGGAGFLQAAFILNLPTSLFIWLLGADFVLLTPLTQIVFWFCLFVYFARRRRSKLI